MTANEAKKRYKISDMWCDAATPKEIDTVIKTKACGYTVTTGKSECGKHVTIDTCDISYMSEHDIDLCASVISDQLMLMAKENIHNIRKIDPVILVCCLGNRNITCDSLAPLCKDELYATYHLRYLKDQTNLYSLMGGYRLAVIAPGTIGESGIDPSKILSAVASITSPDVVIAVDSLASSCDERLGKTVQLSNAGITPGSGVGNRRTTIDSSLTGAFTVGIGIPTVICSSTLIFNAFEKAKLGLEDIPQELTDVLENGLSYFVTPKNSDMISKCGASLLAKSITRFCEDLASYMGADHHKQPKQM